jgi:sigma-B regulation protein RsbQ
VESVGIDPALRRNNVVVTGNADGPTMVFAHGFGCSQLTWRKVAPAFESTHRVVLFDHVGAGESDVKAYDRVKYNSLQGYATDVLEIIDALDTDDVTFVGHSVSAMIGVLAANRRPELFRQLVLVGPSPRYVDDGDYEGGFTKRDIDDLLDTLDANYLGWSERMAPVIMGNPERPELGEDLTQSFCRLDPEIARQFAHVTFLSDNRRDLADVVVPTLIIECTDDVIAPTGVGQFVHESIRGSELLTLPTRGHIPLLSGPQVLVDAIYEGLR